MLDKVLDLKFSAPVNNWLEETLLTPVSINEPAPAIVSPPIASMDAGPNVHLIVEAADADLWRERLTRRYGAGAFLEDGPGGGAACAGR